MPYINISIHLVYGLFLFSVSALISLYILKHAKVLDKPNSRSSHQNPTPTTGGLAIFITFFLGMAVYYLAGNESMIKTRFFFGFALSSLLIAGVSYSDDLKFKPLIVRLAIQIVATLTAMAFGLIINKIHATFFALPLMTFAGYGLTLLWVIGLTNAYNFMDGLNGMAGGNAVVAGLCLSVISFTLGSHFTYIVSYTLAAAAAGFTVFNVPKGKLFMGDVGSTFIGFAFATLAIIAALYDNSHTSLLVVPMLLFHFIFDTVFSFTRRLIKGENVFEAHRTHLYQLLNQLGWSHNKVSTLYCCLGVIQGGVAMWGAQRPDLAGFLPFIPFTIAYGLCAWKIVSLAQSKKLL